MQLYQECKYMTIAIYFCGSRAAKFSLAFKNHHEREKKKQNHAENRKISSFHFQTLMKLTKGPMTCFMNTFSQQFAFLPSFVLQIMKSSDELGKRGREKIPPDYVKLHSVAIFGDNFARRPFLLFILHRVPNEARDRAKKMRK